MKVRLSRADRKLHLLSLLVDDLANSLLEELPTSLGRASSVDDRPFRCPGSLQSEEC